MLAEKYNEKLAQCLEKHAPLKRKVITIRQRLPWYNEDLLAIKRKKRKAERKWKLDKTEENLKEYRSLSVSLHSEIASAKWNHLNKEITKHARNNKLLYRTMFHMMGKKKENPIPEASSQVELAETFADYFYNKIQNIRDELQEHRLYETSENTS